MVVDSVGWMVALKAVPMVVSRVENSAVSRADLWVDA